MPRVGPSSENVELLVITHSYSLLMWSAYFISFEAYLVFMDKNKIIKIYDFIQIFLSIMQRGNLITNIK